MSYHEYRYGNNVLFVDKEELIELATNFNVLSKDNGGNDIHIENVLKELNEKISKTHDVEVALKK